MELDMLDLAEESRRGKGFRRLEKIAKEFADKFTEENTGIRVTGTFDILVPPNNEMIIYWFCQEFKNWDKLGDTTKEEWQAIVKKEYPQYIKELNE